MSRLSHPLFNPFADHHAQIDAALKIGFIEPKLAEALAKIGDWVDANADKLISEFGFDVVIVAADDEADEGMAFYPGSDLFEGWSRATQFSCGRPWIAFDPLGRSYSRALIGEPFEGAAAIGGLIAGRDGAPFFMQDDGGGDKDEDALEMRRKEAEERRIRNLEKMKKDRLEKIAENLKKRNLNELLP